jgi:hypothetical protein
VSDIVLDWVGHSGRMYRYWLLERTFAADIKDEAGNYVFVNRLQSGHFIPLYFGIAENLRTRIPKHEKWPEALRLGAIGIMAHTTQGGAATRLAEEQDLISYWEPPLNVHYRVALSR